MLQRKLETNKCLRLASQPKQDIWWFRTQEARHSFPSILDQVASCSCVGLSTLIVQIDINILYMLQLHGLFFLSL